jgi:hypothetical protein
MCSILLSSRKTCHENVQFDADDLGLGINSFFKISD